MVKEFYDMKEKVKNFDNKEKFTIYRKQFFFLFEV